VRWTQSLKDDSVDERARQFDQMMAKHGWQTPVAALSLVSIPGAGGEWRWASDRPVAPSIAADTWRDIDKRIAGRLDVLKGKSRTN
jgi:hypothetical protein